MKPASYLSLVLLLALSPVLTGAQEQFFPDMEIETILERTVRLPADVQGKVVLILLGFERKEQATADAWLDPFIAATAGRSDVAFFEIPMLDGWLKGFLSGTIRDGFRKQIPPQKAPGVALFFGDVDRYRSFFGVQSKKDWHLFLLDQRGVVRWRERGDASPEKLSAMRAVLADLISQGR